MNTEPTNERRRFWITVVVATMALSIISVLIVPFVVQLMFVVVALVRMNNEINETREMLLNNIDHVAVRDAGRTLLSQCTADGFITAEQLPPLFHEMGTQWGEIGHDGRLRLEFGGGFHHHGLLVVPPSDERAIPDEGHTGYTSLVEGLWYYEDTD